MRRAQQRHPTKQGRSRSLLGFAIAAFLAVALYGGAAVATGTVEAPTAPPETGPLVATSNQATAIVAARPKARASADPGRPSDRLIWSVRGAVTGQFGEHRGGHEHAGLDIPAPSGTPIRAASAGTVVMRESQDGYGNYTCIAHVKVSTCYAHQSRFRVKQGARVKRGQLIGHVGNTGTSETPHLHFEVRRGRQPWGTPVDPAKYLPRR